MTLKEIAQKAGVSISTVSRVLNQPNTKAASPEVQARIWEIVQHSGYTPNTLAKRLQQGGHGETVMRPIYCLIARPPEEVKGDPFYTQMTASIEKEAFRNHFVLKYTYSILDLDDPAMLRQLKENDQDSLIVIGRFGPDLLAAIKKKFQKIVYTGLNELSADCDQVICDGYAAIQEAVRYLRELGHEQIAFIGAEEEERRYQGYLEALRRQGLPLRPELVISGPSLSMEGGYQGLRRLREQAAGVTAVVCANDMIAIGALQACRVDGIHIPEDLSIIGMNDIENVRFVQPMLTSIHVPIEELGRVAARVLVDRIDGGHELPLKVSLPYHIVERESCARRKNS